MKFYGRRGKKTYRKLRKTGKRKASTKVSQVVKRYVKKAIHNSIENKRYTIETADTLAASSNATNFQAGNIWQLTPSTATNSWYTIPQGLGEGGRVGNSISVRKADFRYVMYPLGYSASNLTPKPLDVMLFIFSVKRGVTGLTVLDAWNIFNTNIFANGSSSNGTVNNLFDACSTFNTDVVTIHHRRMLKLGANSDILQTGGNAQYANNDYKYNCIGKINITKYLPKKIMFNDADNNSTSKQVFLIISPMNADGTTISSVSFPLAVYSGLDLTYEDA